MFYWLNGLHRMSDIKRHHHTGKLILLGWWQENHGIAHFPIGLQKYIITAAL